MDQKQLDFLTQQKIELILKMKTQKFEDELNTLREHISNLQSDIMSLRRELSNRPVQQENTTAPVNDTKTESQATHQEPKQKQGEKSGHPRQGKYTSDDVSIEKFFNYSGK